MGGVYWVPCCCRRERWLVDVQRSTSSSLVFPAFPWRWSHWPQSTKSSENFCRWLSCIWSLQRNGWTGSGWIFKHNWNSPQMNFIPGRFHAGGGGLCALVFFFCCFFLLQTHESIRPNVSARIPFSQKGAEKIRPIHASPFLSLSFDSLLLKQQLRLHVSSFSALLNVVMQSPAG